MEVVLLALGWTVVASESTEPRAIVLFNATVHTMVDERPRASALCFSVGGRIAAVGADAHVLRSPCARQAGVARVDLHGATVLPGLSDSHAHLMLEAARLTQADLSEASSAHEMAVLAARFASEHPPAAGGWLQGMGWDQTRWVGGRFPTHADLDELLPDVPAYLQHISGHAAVLNGAALRRIGPLPRDDPPGGRIERDAAGEPTGVLTDNAMNIALAVIPPWTDAEADAALERVLDECAASGLTGVHDLAAFSSDIRLFQRRARAHGREGLRLRVYAMRRADEASPHQPKVQPTSPDSLLTVRAVKLFADGAMGSWTAAMLEAYSDAPRSRGTLIYTDAELAANVSAWARAGYQIATHAIGDAANRQVLDAYEQVLSDLRAPPGADALRWRIEHAQILAAPDIARFARLGVIPSMQPSHVASDLSYADARLGPERARRSYAWASLLDAGVRCLPFGSDFPTAGTVPPLAGMHAAVTRQTAAGQPAGGWHPEQRVSRERALRGYTVDSAYARFAEHELGRIREDFLADLTIVDRDVLAVPSDELLYTRVLATIVGGRATFDQARLLSPPVAPPLALRRGAG
ncbi:hypothetical protein KFE25_007423 [Diacronema lutheri]|uniref:Amidohydrolase 3 domain-containing protein n=1 Tax=Diacronema lutheri TaxID=2081491 RepID=A0A8J6CGB3_DIALT|nr:hypothetical protein KFE25_007423 [Diacronema lutheri]